MFDRVFIATHRHDIRYTRACAASVRFWNPTVDIFLIKDLLYGDFPLWDLKRSVGVHVAPTSRTRHGWGFSKLEPLFHEWAGRFFVMDSDILWMGDMQRALSDDDADFVVDEETPSPSLQQSNYFDPTAISTFDPRFIWPGYSFNTGQWAGKSGMLKREDFGDLVDWSQPVRPLRPELFRLGEQGLQNYLFQKLSQEGRMNLMRKPIMRVADTAGVAALPPAGPAMREDMGFLIHWCGLKRPRFDQMIRSDLWDFFNRTHYNRIPGGRFLYLMREMAFFAERRMRAILRPLRTAIRR